MARPAKESDEAVLTRAMTVFRALGYEGASLSKLSEATELKRASLYHRFPGGKEDLATSTLAALGRWLDAQVLSPLKRPGDPKKRLEAAASAFDALFDGGKDASLINVFGTPEASPQSLVDGAQSLALAMITGIAAVLEETGLDPDEARTRAVRGVALLEGSMVLARAFRDPAPFRAALATWPDELLGPSQTEKTAPAAEQPEKTESNEEPPKQTSEVRRAVARHLALLNGRSL
ncbi:MAG: TetR/AcrR family transcriptional regulator [Pseudomonadota bacterium]